MSEFPTEYETIPVVVPAEPLSILQAAVQRGASIETIERLVELKIKMDDRQAAADFNVAMAAFAGECPSVPKTKVVRVVSTKGSEFSYKYAELDQIAAVTRPYLSKHGLSYTWDSAIEDTKIVATCTVRHVGGHSQSSTFTCPVKAKTDSMSPQQEVAAALTYAKRQALIQVLGLTTSDPDFAAGGDPNRKISPEQVEQIEALLKSTGADRAGFLRYTKADDVPSILERHFAMAITALEAKVKK